MNVTGMFNALVSHCLSTGLFASVNQHEPKSKPVSPLTAAVWVQNVDPAPLSSGLAATSARVEFNVRIYTSMLQEPQDAIDPAVLDATDKLLELFSGDFELGGVAMNIDLQAQHGVGLAARAGYLDIGGTIYRVVTIIVPVIVADAYTQSA